MYKQLEMSIGEIVEIERCIVSFLTTDRYTDIVTLLYVPFARKNSDTALKVNTPRDILLYTAVRYIHAIIKEKSRDLLGDFPKTRKVLMPRVQPQRDDERLCAVDDCTAVSHYIV